MDNIHEQVELRLSRELFRACIIGAVGSIVCGISMSLASIYLYSLNIGMGQPFNATTICVTATIGAVLFALGKTWCVRILPEGVQARCLFLRQTWRWQDFQNAEAGRAEIYFPQLPLWRRYLFVGFAEGDAFERAWKILVDHVPPKEPWSGPITLWSGPFTKLTLMHGGVRRRRLLLEQDFSWDDVDRAVVFRSDAAQRGFVWLKIVLRGSVYQWHQFRTLRKGGKRPADYDVVDVLAAHVRKERMIFCGNSSHATTLEEVEERKKMAANVRVYGALSGLIMAALILYVCGKALYRAADQWRLMQSYWGLAALLVGLLFLAAILYVGVGIVLWRESRQVEKQLDDDVRSIAAGRHGKDHKEG